MKPHSLLLRAAIVTALGSVLFLSACSKRTQAANKPPAIPPPPAPTATLSATPQAIAEGAPVTIRWSTTNAKQVTISGIGTVDASGSKQVAPNSSITYELVAIGPGGEADASARVTVNQIIAGPSEKDLFSKDVQDIFFDYDKYGLRPDESPTVRTDAQFLENHPDIKIMLEGHCDERGSDEYNLALGQSRVESVMEVLVRLGVSSNRIQMTSYGKERPFCTASTEQCWQQNRRAHFVMAQ